MHLLFRNILFRPASCIAVLDPEGMDDFDLATRLSYFLTQGPPDKTLVDLAQRGRLSATDRPRGSFKNGILGSSKGNRTPPAGRAYRSHDSELCRAMARYRFPAWHHAGPKVQLRRNEYRYRQV